MARKFNAEDWKRVATLKAQLVDNEDWEAEDAEEEAADRLGYDYDDVLEYLSTL